MATRANTDWKQELGVSDWGPPTWFDNTDQLAEGERSFPQAHAVRRAFDELKLSGVLCLGDAPVVYFREVQRIRPEEVRELHRRFWNQGLAPILVLISPTDVHVYSGLAPPRPSGGGLFDESALVAKLNRVANAGELRQLILSVESGEFFRRHHRAFDPSRRVDRELLRNLNDARDELNRVSKRNADPAMLDALLCRVIFASYLFDRGIIDCDYVKACGISGAGNLREIIRHPKGGAKSALYKLFDKLGSDFNGDLFRDDLEAESRLVTDAHLKVLDRLLHGSNPRTGQGAFWPYDFSIIPIETISAIYEHFLKSGDPDAKKETGAFYTRRFLAEIILDLALEGMGSLLGKRFFDPACGSGIFLVGLFSRLAEEWKRANPNARYDARATGLMSILQENLFGADLNPTACRITAFSLYLAFLDHLSPPDIQKLQSNGKMLPRLVFGASDVGIVRSIYHGDFFEADGKVPTDCDLVIGNPPWISETDSDAPFVRWCTTEGLALPDRQAAIAFAWKAPRHLNPSGRVCLILPHGVIFNHGTVSLRFQREWLTAYGVEMVLNLADFQRLLFEEAENPAVVIRYRGQAHPTPGTLIRYLTPKMDWSIAQAEVLTIHPQDQKLIPLREVLADLNADSVPVAWKERYWGTPRDWKLLDRLRELPELKSLVGHGQRRWTIGQGFQEPGAADEKDETKQITLPSRNLVEARGSHLSYFLLESDCVKLRSRTVTVRSKSNSNTEVFVGPHVLITDGFKVVYCGFDAAFRQSVRGIKGPPADAKLLMFLSVYLNSPLAKYYLFHTAANLGVERAKAESGDVLRLPFPLPADAPAGKNADRLVDLASSIYRRLSERAAKPLADRAGLIRAAIPELTDLVYEYFDIDSSERMLVEDTNNVLLRSTRRRRASERVPTLRASTPDDRDTYAGVVCGTLNDWTKGGVYEVRSTIHTSAVSGMGVVEFAKVERGNKAAAVAPNGEFLSAMIRVQRAFKKNLGTVEVLRDVKVFDGDKLYVLKPLNQRFWTRSAALNDADEIAGAVLTKTVGARA